MKRPLRHYPVTTANGQMLTIAYEGPINENDAGCEVDPPRHFNNDNVTLKPDRINLLTCSKCVHYSRRPHPDVTVRLQELCHPSSGYWTPNTHSPFSLCTACLMCCGSFDLHFFLGDPNLVGTFSRFIREIIGTWQNE